MRRRFYFCASVGLLAVLGAISQTANDDKVKLECVSGSRAPQCPSGSNNGVLLVAQTTVRTDTDDRNVLEFGRIDEAYKQVVGFRRGRAPAYKKDVNWTTAPDTATLTYADRYELPVRIWAICPDTSGTCGPLTARRERYLTKFVVKANAVLNSERVGIRLVASEGTLISDETPKLDNPTNFKNFDDSSKCPAFYERVAGLDGSGAPKRLIDLAVNIYVVSTVDRSFGKGINCPNDNAKLAVVGATADWSTILHEVGHGLSLQHPEEFHSATAWGGDLRENFMYSATDESTRKFFTEGQTFRAHFNDASAVNRFLGRPIVRYCGLTDSDAEEAWVPDPRTALHVPLPCPKLGVRVWPE